MTIVDFRTHLTMPDRVEPALWTERERLTALRERRRMLRHVRLLHVLVGVLRRQERRATILPSGVSDLLQDVERALETATWSLGMLMRLIDTHEEGRIAGPAGTSDLVRILEDHSVWLDSKGRLGRQANLRGRDLRGADLSGKDLSAANLRDADLRGANLTNTVFTEADVRGADFCGALMAGASFYCARTEGALGLPMEGADA